MGSSRHKISGQVIVIACLILGYIPVGAAAWHVYLKGLLATRDLVAGIIYFLIIYSSLAYCYFHVFNMSETARRIRILNEIYKARGLKISELKSFYNANAMLSNRLERLISLRQIRMSGEKYVIGSHLLYYTARVINLWGRVLGLDSIKTVYTRKG